VTDWSARGAVVRLHVGLEAPSDLLADLARGLAALDED
jgi:cystathionine beta-lyase